MSLTMVKAEGVTVFTLTSDPQGHYPPLCQILKCLCYKPAFCQASQHMKRGNSQSALGALYIMAGLINMVCGGMLLTNGRVSYMVTAFPYWVGALFILFGVVGILSEKYPSKCLVLLNASLNLSAAAFAIAAIVLYSICFEELWMSWMCDDQYYLEDAGWPRHRPTSRSEQILKEKCEEGETLTLMLMRTMNVMLIVLSVLELFVALSTVVLGIKALCSSSKTPKNQSVDDPECHKPLLEEVASDPVQA